MLRYKATMWFLSAILAVGWATNVYAQSTDNTVFREQTGIFPNFPYRDCASKIGIYRLAPDVKSLGSGKYCFTIKVANANCAGSCCAADLSKIEFNVSSACIVQPAAEVKATINGIPTRVGASFDKPENGRPGSAILRITQLGLNAATAKDAELCITLKPNRPGQGCTTLEALCPTPAGAPAGTCVAAMYDTACNCCPVSQASLPIPPPPSMPPSPSIVPSFQSCNVCIIATLTPPGIDVRPYRWDKPTCASIQAAIASDMNSIIIENNLAIPPSSYFTAVPDSCTGTIAAVCGAFNSTYSSILSSAAQSFAPSWIETASGGSVCRPELEGYTVGVQTDSSTCLNATCASSCILANTPFPNCTCNTTQGILPFTVSPRYVTMPDNNTKSTTTEYCFYVSAIPATQIVNSTCGSANASLMKVEWYANQAKSSAVKGFNLYPASPANGTVTKMSPSWGATGANTLKVSNINWTVAQANGGRICVELKNPTTMQDMCLGDPANPTSSKQCYVSVFNSNKACCPIYRTDALPSRT